MDTLQSSQTRQKTDSQSQIDSTEHSYSAQWQIIKDFFQKDSGSEMIESLNTLIEAYLFTENLTRVTPEMREHIVNQLRVATLIAKLDASNDDIVKHSPPL
ncbi:MAG TPA: hypothetical protein VN038_24450 [Dyadobacter sp.]|nr:hypothetical protein [Dyadobacter sp.]